MPQTKRTRCVNIDWLELYCLECSSLYPCDADYFRRAGFNVREREYGTRIYREMFVLLDNDERPFIEVRRNPFSTKEQNQGFFEPYSCHIRLVNRYCYHNDPIGLMRQFLITHRYTLVKISRIDICLDFEKFDFGDDPKTFLLRYMAGRYSKINQANINAHGRDQWDGRDWNSVSWGKPKSMIGTKFYNKTLELQEAHDKPYIRQAWFEAGLIDDPINQTKRDKDGHLYKPTIWRVEFSIKSSAKKWFVIEKNTTRKKKLEARPHTLDMYDTRAKLYTVFASLAEHYFHFKHYEKDQRKDRCPDKKLFNFSALDSFYKIQSETLATDIPQDRDKLRLLTKLEHYRQCHFDSDVRNACDVLIASLNKDRQRDFLTHPWNVEEVQALQLAIAQKINSHSTQDAAILFHQALTLLKEDAPNYIF